MGNGLLLNCEIRLLKQTDIPLIVQSFSDVNWPKSASLYEKYVLEQEKGQRIVWLAFWKGVFAGYATLKWQSDYSPFKEQNIPEINDLNVLPQLRRKGIGSKLLDVAEERVRLVGQYVGLGVGLYEDYGNAQRLYVQRGYIPNGQGITYRYDPITPGHLVCVDDDLILWFVKDLALSHRV